MIASSRKLFDWHTPALLGVLLLSAFLGFYHLGRESLWADELATWQRTAEPSLAESITTGAVDSMWAAYHVPLYLFAKLAGDTEFALRFPSSLAAVMAVAALYALGRYLYSSSAGLAGAALMSVSLTQVQYSQEARLYAVEMLVMILMMWFWLRLLAALGQGRGKVWKPTLLYFAAAAVVIYLHIMGLLILALHGLAALAVTLRRGRGFWLMSGLYAALAVLTIPILLTVPDIMKIKNEFIHLPGALPGVLAEHLTYAFSGDSVLVAALLVIGAISLGGVLLRRRPEPQNGAHARHALSPAWVLAIWYMGPFLILYGLSFVLRPVLHERYLLMCQPAIYLLAGIAVTRLPVRRLIRSGAVIAMMALLLVDLVGVREYYTRLQKPDYRGMVNYSLTATPDGKDVLVLGIPWPIPQAYRYYLRAGRPQNLTISGAFMQGMMTDALLKHKPDRVWYLHTTSKRKNIRFLRLKNYQFIESRDFTGDYTMSLYEGSIP